MKNSPKFLFKVSLEQFAQLRSADARVQVKTLNHIVKQTVNAPLALPPALRLSVNSEKEAAQGWSFGQPLAEAT